MHNTSIIWKDNRRVLVAPGDSTLTLRFCAEHWLRSAKTAIADHGFFAVALSGGSTPKAIFELLATPEFAATIDWSKVKLFWSDERCVAPDNNDSNYKMAMSSGLGRVPIDPKFVFRMPADRADLHLAAQEYERLLQKELHQGMFDLIMLGMGDDGHTASLFPNTEGLSEKRYSVIANYVPQKQCWRLTFTFPAIHKTRDLCVYTLGENKASMLYNVLKGEYLPTQLPAQAVGTEAVPALWIVDKAATSLF
ncbi:MAG: pgl [Chlamydiales bacterium]|jgi:6-phosphogluconolactonase|nr:pgl [Chlamydiales bacterium]